MPRILVLQNSRDEGIGNLGRMMRADGFELDVTDAKNLTASDISHEALVVLGGQQSANDDLPYLRAEENAILRYAKAQKPVLGICLGAQLAARALGGRVYAGAKREVGFYGDLTAADPDPLFSGMKNFDAFHWHGDTFDLPDGSVRLVRSEHYENQAFRHGTVVGLQFHLEADSDMIVKWLTESADYAGGPGNPKAGDILRQMDGRMTGVTSSLEKFYSNFRSEFFP